MRKTIRTVAVGALALAGAIAATGEAGAMPSPNLAPTVSSSSSIEKAYVVCGRWHCWHRGWRRWRRW